MLTLGCEFKERGAVEVLAPTYVRQELHSPRCELYEMLNTIRVI